MPPYSVRRSSYNLDNTVANIPPLYWILFIIRDEWKYCAVFTWFISIRVEKVLFSYIEHCTDSWNRNLEVLHTWVLSANFIQHQTLCVIFGLNFPHTKRESEVIRLAGGGGGAVSHSCSSFRCASLHSPSFLLEFQSSVKVCCFLPHLNVRNPGSNLKQNTLINPQRILYLVKRHQRVYMEIGG